jgi:hypothetical protein
VGKKSWQYDQFMNKRRSGICNRSTVYLGQPFATLPSTNMTRFNQHTTTLSKALLTASLLGGAALSTLGAGSAQAMQFRNDCSFGSSTAFGLCSAVNWSSGWLQGDKTLTNLTYFPTIPTGPAGGPPSGVFSFIWDDFTTNGVSPDDMWTVLAEFNPALPPPNTGSYSYDLAIDPVLGAGLTFKDVELDVDHAGTGQDVTKVVKNALGSTIATLNSVNGMPDGPDPISGTSISVTDSWDLDPNTGTIMSISNSYTQTPAPLPILGAAAALGSIRKLRKFSSRLKTFSMR